MLSQLAKMRIAEAVAALEAAHDQCVADAYRGMDPKGSPARRASAKLGKALEGLQALADQAA